MDVQQAIEMLARLEHVVDELDETGTRLVIEVTLDTRLSLVERHAANVATLRAARADEANGSGP